LPSAKFPGPVLRRGQGHTQSFVFRQLADDEIVLRVCGETLQDDKGG